MCLSVLQIINNVRKETVVVVFCDIIKQIIIEFMFMVKNFQALQTVQKTHTTTPA